VYGETLLRDHGVEYRSWDANRSKLAAYLKRSGRVWPFTPSSAVLYLGAGSGTTVSHVSDLCARGSIVAVEISPRVFRDLVSVAETRPNLVPVLGDAARPDTYASHAGTVDILYQDVAQRDQVDIFLRNVRFLRPKGVGWLLLKARSVDVAARPPDVYRRSGDALRSAGLDILDERPLDPFQEDHCAFVVRKR
jgi:fibrillarin-like pre-rRNA processing protein